MMTQAHFLVLFMLTDGAVIFILMKENIELIIVILYICNQSHLIFLKEKK